jgi:sec-independent protein translocase protein TatA
MPFALSPWHILIVVAVLLLVFGPKRLPGMARSTGKRMKETKEAVVQAKDEMTAGLNEPGAADPVTTAAQAPPQPQEQAARTVVGDPEVQPVATPQPTPPSGGGAPR